MTDALSWWVGLDREAFTSRARLELDRMRREGARWTMLIRPTGVELVARRVSRPAQTAYDAAWDEIPGTE